MRVLNKKTVWKARQRSIKQELEWVRSNPKGRQVEEQSPYGAFWRA